MIARVMGGCTQRRSDLLVSRKHGRGVSLLELMFSVSFFLVLSIITILSLRQITGIWTRTSERDLALRQLLRADRFLQADLANSATGSGQSAFQLVGAGSGPVMTGHALALLLPSEQPGELVVTSAGMPVLDRLVTYYLAVPQNVQALTGLSYNYTAGGNGQRRGPQ